MEDIIKGEATPPAALSGSAAQAAPEPISYLGLKEPGLGSSAGPPSPNPFPQGIGNERVALLMEEKSSFKVGS